MSPPSEDLDAMETDTSAGMAESPERKARVPENGKGPKKPYILLQTGWMMLGFGHRRRK